MSLEDEIAKLPPKIDVAEVATIQAKLEATFAVWQNWMKQRQTWHYVYTQSQAWSELTWVYELVIGLMAARPDQAPALRDWIMGLTNQTKLPGGLPGRLPIWHGNEAEGDHEAALQRRAVMKAVEAKYVELGVRLPWNKL